MADSVDTRGLFIIFEPELTLSLLPTWWIEIPTITAVGRCYTGIIIDELIFFDWTIARDGSVMGLSFFPTQALPDSASRELRATLESLPYVDDSNGLPTVWFSENRDRDEGSSIFQDFAASFYVSDAGSWGLALNIDWLPLRERERLPESPARWVHAECQLVEPGKGVSLCKGLPFPALYQLRGWFGSSEGRDDYLH